MLIVPVVRFLNVTYNQSIGFIRRLCIRVDANDDFLEANIVELVGNLEFVEENHNAIFKNYKENNITGFSGVVVIYEIAYDLVVAKEYYQGIFSKNTQIEVESDVTARTEVCFRRGRIWIEFSCANHPDGNNCSRLPGGYWQDAFIETVCPRGDSVSSGGGSSGGGSTGGATGTSGSSGGGYIPYVHPITILPPKGYEIPPVVTPTISNVPQPPNTSNTPMPFPGMVLDEEGVWVYPIDNGHSWNDLIEEDENTVSSGITEDPSLFLPENADIKAIYDAIKTQPEWTNYIKYFNANNPANSSLTIKIGDMPAGHEESLGITNRDYQTNTATIIINQNKIRGVVPTNIALVILHEGIHAKLFSLIKRNLKGLVLTTAEKTELINLERMMKLYGRNNSKGEHTYIGRYYLNSLIRGMKAFQTLSPTITDLHYKALIFAGLGNTPDVKAFIDGLPNGEADSILMLLEITID